MGRSTYFTRICTYSLLTALASPLAGCIGVFPTINDTISPSDMAQFRTQLQIDDISQSNLNNLTWRKNYITMQMYEIDKEYDVYWQQIEESDTFISFGGDVAQLGLTTAATAIPVVQTTKVLAAVATGVGASKTSYKQEFLAAKTREAIKSKADANKLSVGKTILARLNCSPDAYPWPMALQDVDSYREAGTFESALASLIQSASSSQAAASAATGKAAPVTVSPAAVIASPAGGGGAAKGVAGGAADPNKGTLAIAGGKLNISFTPNSTCPLQGAKAK